MGRGADGLLGFLTSNRPCLPGGQVTPSLLTALTNVRVGELAVCFTGLSIYYFGLQA